MRLNSDSLSCLSDVVLQYLTVDHIHEQKYRQAGIYQLYHNGSRGVKYFCEVWLEASVTVPGTQEEADDPDAEVSTGVVDVHR